MHRPPITQLQEQTLSLLSRRSPFGLELLKQALLLRLPPPPPLAGVSWLPYHYVRFVSTCAITSASALLLAPHALCRALAAAAALLALPCTAARDAPRRNGLFRFRRFAGGEEIAMTSPARGSGLSRLRGAATELLRSNWERLVSPSTPASRIFERELNRQFDHAALPISDLDSSDALPQSPTAEPFAPNQRGGEPTSP